jgi:hypothetical protein
MVELFCDSFEQVPRRIVLDIDDTEDRVHGHQQLSLFHAHYDSRCFLPIHIYEAVTGKPVAVILRPGKTPDGAEVALVLRHVVKAIRARWPRVEILIRGDSHYARPEGVTWPERNRVGYIFGLAGNKTLHARATELAEDAALARVAGEAAKVRRYGMSATARAAGRPCARSSPVSRPRPRAQTAASSSPISPVRRAGSTRRSTAPVAGPRTGSRPTSCISPPTAPPAPRPPPTSSASRSTPPPTGSCTRCVVWRRRPRSGAKPSSTPSVSP